MTSNKDRLYVALYARGVETSPRTYYWALFRCPKAKASDHTSGVRYHVKNSIRPGYDGLLWYFEQKELGDFVSGLLLVRVLVAKIEKPDLLDDCVRRVPIVQDDKNWTCRIWVRDALASLDTEGVLGTKVTDWMKIEEQTKHYAEEKHAVDRWRDPKWDARKTATWDMLKEKETCR